MEQIQRKSILVQVSAGFELLRVRLQGVNCTTLKVGCVLATNEKYWTDRSIMRNCSDFHMKRHIRISIS